MDKMLQILLIFAERGDAIVKGYLAKRPVLENLLSLLDILSDRAVVVLLKAIRVLTMEVRPSIRSCVGGSSAIIHTVAGSHSRRSRAVWCDSEADPPPQLA